MARPGNTATDAERKAASDRLRAAQAQVAEMFAAQMNTKTESVSAA
jgi:hypothetical protein